MTGTEKENAGILQRIRDEFSFVRGNFLVMVISWHVLDFFIELPGARDPPLEHPFFL